MDCCKVVFFRHGGRVQFVHVLPRHYERLQYPLLFPHGTLGWGILRLGDTSLGDSAATRTDISAYETCGLIQLQWCRAMLLAEPRFLTLGRFPCEHLVDMYSGIKETNLDYLRRARLMQSSAFDCATDPIASDLLRNSLLAIHWLMRVDV